MDVSRRTLCLSLPALAATAALAADHPGAPIPSFAKPFASLPVHQNGANASRPILDGTTHSSDHLEVHETTLAPGSEPHPPHRHAHEELFLIMQGTLAVTISGKTTTIGPGSAAFVHSGELHGVRNPGAVPAQYFVVAIGN
ncbi:MAG TPA: cupin domain-containing protein [Pirellulales bacterium]|jgi:mannose-6-phosphate isomerase-like protein (cupin superfamily)|nr:cupin domain-containing protein [Pirellulales bacterium]